MHVRPKAGDRWLKNRAVGVANESVVPLTDLLMKDVFQWNDKATEAFSKLKMTLTTVPLLCLPDFSVLFVVDNDAFVTGIEAILLQHEQPVAYFSKKLRLHRLAASTYHKELYAIVEAIHKWRQYLLGREFLIRTDQRSLRKLSQQEKKDKKKPSTIEVLKYCFTSQDGEPTTFVFEIETRYNTIKSQQTQ
ncbi:unnamed protein product [Cuscuta campestris]|uniref:Reverse transcriptase/retrotransposon-derived protein RNase H-like domain-containing protein n=1 Tax=Cuscuta campestris TaxID=132261 RepID=A0A484N6L8_9ASTE|nr:unnamed protein product [Cuscuta campestris]